jgi:hypothetical protein
VTFEINQVGNAAADSAAGESSRSSLHEEVHVVDAQRVQFGVRSLDIEQQSAEGHKDSSVLSIS